MSRPITRNTRKAQRDRERVRAAREAMKVRPLLPINPKPLAQVVQQWSKT
jgi:hypothetical protein